MAEQLVTDSQAVNIINNLINFFDSTETECKSESITIKEYKPISNPKNSERDHDIDGTRLMQISNHILHFKNNIIDSNYILQIPSSGSSIPVQHNISDLNTEKEKLLWYKHLNILQNELDCVEPIRIKQIFINESNTECVLVVGLKSAARGCFNVVSSFCISFTNWSSDQIPKLSDFKNQTLLLSLDRNDRIIGFIGDILIKSSGKYFDSSFMIQYYDKTHREWINCVVDDLLLSYHYDHCDHAPFVVLVPKRGYMMKYALWLNTKLYGICANKKLMKFERIRIIDNETKKDIDISEECRDSIIFNEIMFYLKHNCLYMVEWLNDKCLCAFPMLQWMTSLRALYHCGKYGIGITMNCYDWYCDTINNDWIDDKNDHLIIFNPDTNIIYRLKENDINLVQLGNLSHCLWWEEAESILLLMLNNNTPNIVILHDQLLGKLEHKSTTECFDHVSLEYYKSYNCWKSQYSQYMISEEAFTVRKSDDFPKRRDIFEPRSEYVYFCKYKGKCYRLIAGYNCNDDKLKHMKSIDFKSLSKFEELGDYLGAVIWYQVKDANCKRIIYTATMIDFANRLRSTKCISIVKKDECFMQPLSAKHIDWIGIVDANINNTKLFKPRNMLHENDYDYYFDSWEDERSVAINVKYDFTVYTKKHFECTGTMVVIDAMYTSKEYGAQLTDVMVGKWYRKRKISQDEQGRDCQLLVYHESVMGQEKYTDGSIWNVNREEIGEALSSFCDFDDIDLSKRRKAELVDLLKNYMQDTINDDIIMTIAAYCYTFCWRQQKVLNDEWYLHQKTVRISGVHILGMFAYDKFGDSSFIDDPYKNLTGYDWYHFAEKGNEPLYSLHSEYIHQSVKKKKSSSCFLPHGYATKVAGGEYACLAQIDCKTNKVVAIKAYGPF